MRTGSRAARDAGIHQQRVDAEFHRNCRVRGGADARIDDHRNGRAFLDDANRIRIADAQPAADRRGERHDRRAADLFELLARDRIVADIRQHRKAVVDELLGGVERLARVGMKRLCVADHLELDRIGLEQFSRELRGKHRLFRASNSRRYSEESCSARGR